MFLSCHPGKKKPTNQNNSYIVLLPQLKRSTNQNNCATTLMFLFLNNSRCHSSSFVMSRSHSSVACNIDISDRNLSKDNDTFTTKRLWRYSHKDYIPNNTWRKIRHLVPRPWHHDFNSRLLDMSENILKFWK